MSNTELSSVFAFTLNELVQCAKHSAADNTSSFSDLLLWTPHPESLKTAKGCRLSILAASFIGLETNSQTLLYERIQKIAHKYKYEGEWSKVEKALESPLVPYLQLVNFLEDRTLNEYFGNDLGLLKRVLRSFKVYNPYIASRKRVKCTQRKRGYDDKGHLRESWRPGPIAGVDTYTEPMSIFEPTEYSSFPEIYKEENNNTQCTLVEKNASTLDSDLEGDGLQMKTSNTTTTVQERFSSQENFSRKRKWNVTDLYED